MYGESRTRFAGFLVEELEDAGVKGSTTSIEQESIDDHRLFLSLSEAEMREVRWMLYRHLEGDDSVNIIDMAKA